MLSILSKCRSGDWIASSNALDAEIAQTPNQTKMAQVQAMLAIATIKIRLSNELAARARQLAQLGFGADDAAHLASAEQGRIDIFLTTDDRLIRRARASVW